MTKVGIIGGDSTEQWPSLQAIRKQTESMRAKNDDGKNYGIRFYRFSVGGGDDRLPRAFFQGDDSGAGTGQVLC